MNQPLFSKGCKFERKGFKRQLLELQWNSAEQLTTAKMDVVTCIATLQNLNEEGVASDTTHLRKTLHVLADYCKSELHVDTVVKEGAISCLLPFLKLSSEISGRSGDDQQWSGNGEDEAAKDACFILGLLAVRGEYQPIIADSGALDELVNLVKMHSIVSAGANSMKAQNKSGSVARRAADAITNLAHENVYVKNLVRIKGGIPPLVSLLEAWDPKAQRAAAGALRTLAFRNEENKQQIVKNGALDLLIRMLSSEEPAVHYEAVGVIGNLVHSSGNIKKQVLDAGALQPVISLLQSPCGESQREAALLLGQFATADADYKAKIVQRGAVPPLISMLGNSDVQLKEMATFALGRLAQNSDNQAGILHLGGLSPLLDLLESKNSNLQHNAAFALYGLADNEDNVCTIIKQGGYSRLIKAELIVQASKDCVQKTVKRLEEKLQGRVLGQLLYQLRSQNKTVQQRIATAFARLAPAEDLKTIFYDYRGLEVLLEVIMLTSCDREDAMEVTKDATSAVFELATKIKSTAPIESAPQQPARTVYLGEQYVNNQTLADVTFIVDDQKFYAHRIALLASSNAFRAMFNSGYKERDANTIEIPNIRYNVFELMMIYTYTGQVEVPVDLAQDLLRASDQYLLEGLKHQCEKTISDIISTENIFDIYMLSESCMATQLGIHCVMFVLERSNEMILTYGLEKFLELVTKMVPQLRETLTNSLLRTTEISE
eukprot:g209.t1